MITEFILLFFLSTIPAAFSYFIDYCIGWPGQDTPNTKAIFFQYSFRLAKRRLIKEHHYQAILDQLEGFTDIDLITLTIFLEGRKGFKWEQAVGMCIYCTNVYISLIAATVFFFFVPLHHFPAFTLFFIIPLYSHLILRKI